MMNGTGKIQGNIPTYQDGPPVSAIYDRKDEYKKLYKDTFEPSPSTENKKKDKDTVTKPGTSDSVSGSKDKDTEINQEPGKINIEAFHKDLRKKLGTLSHIQNENDMNRIEGEIPNIEELNDIFKKCADDETIPWDYTADGCYARAHSAAKKFLDEGYNCSKLFVMTGEITEDGNGKPKVINDDGIFECQGKYMPGKWWYHVAPVVFADNDQIDGAEGYELSPAVTAKEKRKENIEPYIIDPAINSEKPLKPEEWIKEYWNGEFPLRFDLTHADVPYPNRPSKDIEPRDFDQERFDKNMRKFDIENRKFTKALEKIKEKAEQKESGETKDKDKDKDKQNTEQKESA
jgi:hypothetical protein